MAESGSSSKSLIVVPAVVTLAITLLRLVGELLDWSPTFFSKAAGGANAVVGIVWLVPVFGIYFAWKLATGGSAPGAGRVILHGLLGFALVVGAVVFAAKALGLGQQGRFWFAIVASLVALWIGLRGWSALARTLIAYGLAARVPVALVMLFAMLGNWGTHYDVAPPNFPEMGALTKWLFIGLVPQMLLWVPFTVYVGLFFGGLALLVPRRA